MFNWRKISYKPFEIYLFIAVTSKNNKTNSSNTSFGINGVYERSRKTSFSYAGYVVVCLALFLHFGRRYDKHINILGEHEEKWMYVYPFMSAIRYTCGIKTRLIMIYGNLIDGMRRVIPSFDLRTLHKINFINF